MTAIPDTTPIIVGAGQINDRPADPAAGMDPVALMAAALTQAEDDADAALLADADWLGVVRQIGFPDLAEVPAGVAAAIGASPTTTFQTEGPNGDSPVMLLNEAANRIGAGEVRIALVTGAEALRTAAALGNRLFAAREGAGRRVPTYAEAHGLVLPTDVYPLYENALRSALGQTLAEAQGESAAIWARMSDVAADSDGAWLRTPVAADTIARPSPANRPIAFPYTKLMVANAAVNQGAGFIVTSVSEARARGIHPARWIFVGNGAAAHEPANVLARDRFDRSAGMEVSIRTALDLNGLSPADIDHVELYSCFPCIPKLARRIVDWPVDRPVTVFGGLTFGGGPIGNYMSHAVAAMVDRLRGTSGTGLLFANGGYATHNHSIVVSRNPIAAARFPRDHDFQADADAARGAVPPTDEGYLGPARVETHTVFFDRDGNPRGGVVVALTPAGGRTLARVAGDDAATCARLMHPTDDPVGAAGVIGVGADDRRWWRFA